MNKKTFTIIILLIIISAIIGGSLGYYFPNFILSISFIGQLFFNALKIIIIPLVIATVIVGLATIRNVKKINRTATKTLLYYLSTTFLAIVVAFILVYIIRPGGNTSMTGAFIPSDITTVNSFSFTNLIGSLLPNNFIKTTSQGNILGLVVFSMFFGAILAGMGTKGKVVIDFFKEINDILIKLTQYFLFIAPLGIFSLVGTFVAQNHSSSNKIFSSLFIYSLTIIIAFLVHSLVVLPLILKLFSRQSSYKYLGKTLPAIFTAMGTSSSAATLPITYDCVVDKNKVDNRAASFTLPLGAMINLNGTAIYLTVGIMFIAQLYHIDLSLLKIIALLGTSLVLSIGASMIPYSTVIIMGIIINIINLPPQAYAGLGLILAVGWFFDHWATAVNVWGDAVGAAVIDNTFDLKTGFNIKKSLPRKHNLRTVGKETNKHGFKENKRKSPKPFVLKRKTTKIKEKHSPSPQKNKTLQSKAIQKPRTTKESSHRKNKFKPQKKNSPFVMPPAPFHILETELHTKDETETKQNENKPRETSLTEETIAREHAKISSQLATLKEKEQKKRTRHISKNSIKIDLDTNPSSTPSNKKDDNENLLKVDFYSDDVHDTTSDNDSKDSNIKVINNFHSETEDDNKAPSTETGNKIIKENQNEISSNTDSNPDKERNSQTLVTSEPSSEYGRYKSRKKVSHQNKHDDNEADIPDNDNPEYSLEKVSFGRKKHKK